MSIERRHPAAVPYATRVFIVGGGPSGLSMALLLERFGIDFVLVERNASVANHPKARGTWTRTMELFRLWGIEEKVKRRGLPDNANGFAFVESLSGHVYGRTPQELDFGQTPAWKCTVAQDAVEEELLAVVRQARHGRALYGHEFIRLEQTGDGVRALCRDLVSGEEQWWSADYLVAADGAGSGIRRMLDITMTGPASLAVMNNDFWEADLSHLPLARQAGVMRVFPADVTEPGGSVFNTNGRDRWLTVTRVGDGTVDAPPQRSDAEVVRLARLHSGIPNLDVRIIHRSVWRVTRQVADRYARGRVFLIGDAAHRFPPTGGYGMNTGIQDAHNLAWKLAMVVKKEAGPALLDTYDGERRPIGRANADFSLGNTIRFAKMDEAFKARNPHAIDFWIRDAIHHTHSTGLGLGFSYDEGALIPDGTARRAMAENRYEPTDRPGARFPHLWLDLARQRSTLDLFDRRFALVHGPQSADWARAASSVSATLGVPIDTHRLAAVDARDGLEMSPYGAVLVRPDGHVAWRMPWIPPDPAASLGQSLSRILGREEMLS